MLQVVKGPPRVWVLTGGIGAGKSFVGALFAKRGIPVLDVDKIAKEVRFKNADRIQARFGTTDPKALREIVFNDVEALADIEAMVVPGVRHELDQRLTHIIVPLAIVEQSKVSYNNRPMGYRGQIVVESSLSDRATRVMARDQIDRQLFNRMVACQATDQDRRSLSDAVILNDGKEDFLQRQVDTLLAGL